MSGHIRWITEVEGIEPLGPITSIEDKTLPEQHAKNEEARRKIAEAREKSEEDISEADAE